MKKSLLLLLGIIFCTQVYTQTPYTIYSKNGDGAELTKNGYISFSSTEFYNYYLFSKALPSANSENYADYEWFLVPVGNDEPMMYYIQNSNGKYLGAGNTSYLSVFDEKSDDGFKFFIQKISTANTNRTKATVCRIYLKYQGTPYLVEASTTISRLELKKKASSSSYSYLISPSPRFAGSIVYNGDMELVANYKASTSLASLPPAVSPEELTSSNTKGAPYFPLDYYELNVVSDTPKSYLVHSNSSSGGKPEDGSYFLRIPSGATVEKPLDVPALDYAFNLKTTIKARSSQAGIKAGSICFHDSQDNLIACEEIILSKANSPEQEYHDPEVWETLEFVFPVDQPEALMKIRITSSLEGNEVLDIDDICMSVQERPHRFIYWNPVSEGANSWLDPANWTDEEGVSSGIPTKRTQVVLREGLSSYPRLESTDKAQCSNIYFEPGARLGNQFYLDYDSAFIQLGFETMKWQALTAPLKGMYSGDYMFDRANPISEMRLYKTENPQTGLFYADWTTSFTTANHPLAPGMPFSFRAGRVFYNTIDEESGAESGSMEFIDQAKLSLPNTADKFVFYDESTKLPTGTHQPVPEEGRRFSHRFIYEKEENGESVVPSESLLVSYPSSVESGEGIVLIGNPLLSELNFAEFYRENSQFIYPEFKLLIGTEFVSGSGTDNESMGTIDSFISVDGDVGTGVIPPLTAFVIRTKENYTGSDLLIKKGAYLPTTTLRQSATIKKQPSILAEVEQNKQTSRSIILISKDHSNAYSPKEDSRKLDIRENSSIPLVYSIADERALEVNRIQDLSQGVYLEVLSKQPGEGELSISLSDLDAEEFYLKDLQSGEILFFNQEKTLHFMYNALPGESKRFYLGGNASSIGHASSPRISLKQEGKQIKIYSPEALSKVEVYNTAGLLLMEQASSGNHSLTLDLELENSLLIIKAYTETGAKTFKILR